METTDGPRFLTARPVAPEPVEPVVPPTVRVSAPRKQARLKKPLNRPFREPVHVDEEPDALARYLGPGRMPKVMIRWPRACGAVMFAVGLWAWFELVPPTYTISGDTVIEWHSRGGAIISMLCLFLGTFLVVTGRPADSRGYSPGWWNRWYVGVCVLGGIAALVVRAAQ